MIRFTHKTVPLKPSRDLPKTYADLSYPESGAIRMSHFLTFKEGDVLKIPCS